MAHKIEGPFKLGDVYTNDQLKDGYLDDPRGQHVAIDANNHGCIAMVVYKMCDDEKSPECEAFAKRIILCLNYLEGIPDECLEIDHGPQTCNQAAAGESSSTSAPEVFSEVFWPR